MPVPIARPEPATERRWRWELQPLTPQQELITHTYPGPGDYTAKLTLRNLLGDENERTVAVAITELPCVNSHKPSALGPLRPHGRAVAITASSGAAAIWASGLA